VSIVYISLLTFKILSATVVPHCFGLALSAEQVETLFALLPAAYSTAGHGPSLGRSIGAATRVQGQMTPLPGLMIH
jgi:hypothetical protein